MFFFVTQEERVGENASFSLEKSAFFFVIWWSQPAFNSVGIVTC
jgi:hypothetical protein